MANLITTPRTWPNKAVVLKIESAYGDDSGPAGADWVQARNVTLTPMDVDKVDTNIALPYFGNSGEIAVGYWAKLAFDVGLAMSGTVAVAPKWGKLLRICGFAETVTALTSVAYNLVSTDFESASAYMYIDGTRHKMPGNRGEAKFKFPAKGTPMISLAVDGLYITPDAAATPSVTRTGWPLEEAVNSTNTGPCTIDGTDLAFSMLEFGLGNKISRVNLPGPQLEVTITDRKPTATVTVLAPPLADFDPFSLREAQEVLDVQTVHGVTAGKICTVNIKAKITGVEYDKIDEMVAYKLTLSPEPVDGNDEIELILT